jgi:cytochrome b pre-mRNA-processing protein 3
MLASLLALVLLRMEQEGAPARRAGVLLTETFIDDMDGTVRQLGIGDHVVGKHVGRMMSALGGRLAAYREAADEAGFAAAVRRNVFRDAATQQAAPELVARRLAGFRDALNRVPYAGLLEGRLP